MFDGLPATFLDVLEETWRVDLAFLTVLALWTMATWMASQKVQAPWRKPLMLGSSLLFMGLMLPTPLAIFLVAFAVILHEVALGSLRHEKWWLPISLGLFGLIYVPACWNGLFMEYEEGSLVSGSLIPWMLLWLTFRKCLYLVYEVHVGRIRQASLTQTLLHLYFLPFLGGRSPVVAWTTLWDHWEPQQTPERLRHGAGTLVKALIALVVRTAITLLATGLAVDMSLNGDLDSRSMLAIWVALDLGYVRKYLFRYGFEQSSIGLLRLFGFQLKDNYEQPLMAVSYADLWRRWNVHFQGLVVGLFYYPTVLRLSRRWRKNRRAAVAVAVLVTFGGHLLLLFHSLAMSLDPTVTIVRKSTFVSLAVFDLLQAVLVILALLGPPLLPSWLTQRPRLQRAVGIFTTFHTRALLFMFFQQGRVVTPARARILFGRALGIRR